jgi:hypothetical protein
MQGSSSMPRERGAAVLPQACSQLLKYMQAAADTYDLQLKVCGGGGQGWPGAA